MARLCDHGCGAPAQYYSEITDLWRCCKFANSCPAVRKKNAEATKLKHKDAPNFNNRAGTGKISGWDNFSEEKITRIRQKSGRTFSDRYQAGLIDLPKSALELNPDLRGGGKKYGYCDSFGSDVMLDSLWELMLANDLDRNSILWSRPSFFRLSNGRSYTPDFYLIEHDIFLDPKTKYFSTDEPRANRIIDPRT